MKNILLLVIFLFVISCNEKKTQNDDFYNRILDVVIENSNGKIVEFPEMYDSLVSKIAEDETEKLKLAEILKSRGFTIVNWGRGNHPLGPRIVVINLKNKDCECEVAKVYYSTSVDSLYQISEKISCKKTGK